MVTKSERYGIVGELEVYRKSLGSGWYQAEVFYDPSKGYMPRYVRLIAVPTADVASIKEVMIQDATPCQEGGFVPAEWCDTQFVIEDFDEKYPHYTADTAISPVGKIRIGHFKATRIGPAILPICLEPRTQPRRIITPQKSVSIQDIKGPLTITALRAALGRNPLTPALIPFEINHGESDQFPAIPPVRGDRTAVVAGILLAMIGAASIVYIRRRMWRDAVPVVALAICLQRFTLGWHTALNAGPSLVYLWS